MKRKCGILQIPFTYRGQSSCLHVETKIAELLGKHLGDQFAAWIQHHADAIMVEQKGISWLTLHNILKSRIVASLFNPVPTLFRDKNNSTANIPQQLLKKARPRRQANAHLAPHEKNGPNFLS